ncbi:MAG: FAD-linked oxidase C-terminal domain-containing protein [Anaerolineae bacterium]
MGRPPPGGAGRPPTHGRLPHRRRRRPAHAAAGDDRRRRGDLHRARPDVRPGGARRRRQPAPAPPVRPRDPADARAVAACVAEIAAAAVAAGGTVSGEHGVGLAKRAFLPWLCDPPTLGAMRDVKAALDPRGTLNPGKVLPPAGDPGAPWPRDDAPPGSPTRRSFSTSTAGAISVAPDDLVLTAPAEATLAAAAAAARAAGRLLPIWSPWPDTTLRDVIGRRLEAPWRTRYGAIGDNVLTVEAVLPDGRPIRAGRAVRKHVAGYALGRLFVGAGGAMGRLEAVGLRLVPAPPSRASLVAGAGDAEAALDAALAARAAGLGLSAVLASPSPVAAAARPALAPVIGDAPGRSSRRRRARAPMSRRTATRWNGRCAPCSDRASRSVASPTPPTTSAAWAPGRRPSPGRRRAGPSGGGPGGPRCWPRRRWTHAMPSSWSTCSRDRSSSGRTLEQRTAAGRTMPTASTAGTRRSAIRAATRRRSAGTGRGR